MTPTPIPTTPVEFDAFLSALPAGAVIDLVPNGQYATRGYLGAPGDLSLKAGQKINGNGATLKVDRTFHTIERPDPATRNLMVLRSVEDGVSISNLTLDCNCDGTETSTQIGVHLGGSNCILQQCKVVNIAGNFKLGVESFAIAVGLDGKAGNLILACEVSDCLGNYTSAINMTGQGLIAKCVVDFPYMKTWAGYFQGILPAGSVDCVIEDNTVNGGVYGIYGDSESERNLKIVGNRFTNTMVGIVVDKSASQQNIVDGLLIQNNTILISPEPCDYPRGGVRIVEEGPMFYRDIKIRDNTIKWAAPGSTIKAYAFCVWSETPTGDNLHGVEITDNTVETGLDWRLNCKDLIVSNNRDLTGALINPGFVDLST